MKKQAKGPKFRVGQVVRIRKGYMHDGFIGQVIDIRQGKDNLEYWLSWLPSQWVVEFALRPLTVREAGPARGRKA